ncbi:MAG: chlororespiratory reduction protein 7 [Elainella sp.]
MADPIMYQEDAYVVLEPNQPEQFLTAAELVAKLQAILETRQADLPLDLQRFNDPQVQAQHLMETACEFDVGPGEYLQWFVVRLEK